MRVAANYHEPSSSAIAMKAVDIAMTLIARDRISFCTARCCSVLTNRACSATRDIRRLFNERLLYSQERPLSRTSIHGSVGSYGIIVRFTLNDGPHANPLHRIIDRTDDRCLQTL